MTMKVFKYRLTPDTSIIDMPVGAKVLSVQVQGEFAELWAMVDPAADTERRRFFVAGTGQPLPRDIGDFIATFQIPAFGLVFHAFEFANV